MFTARRPLVLLIAVAFLGTAAHAQATAVDPHPNGVSFALTYDALGSYLTSNNRFWPQGGAVEVNASFLHGFGATASALGVQTARTPGGVPLNLVVITFGPSYTYTHHYSAHTLDIFAHGLAGEVDGFNGLYPHSNGYTTTSSSAFALLAGGGIDFRLSRHFAVRAVQADYVRTQLPNSLTNVQNSLRLGAGIVLR